MPGLCFIATQERSTQTSHSRYMRVVGINFRKRPHRMTVCESLCPACRLRSTVPVAVEIVSGGNRRHRHTPRARCIPQKCVYESQLRACGVAMLHACTTALPTRRSRSVDCETTAGETLLVPEAAADRTATASVPVIVPVCSADQYGRIQPHLRRCCPAVL